MKAFYVLLGILTFWCILTIWVQYSGASKISEVGNEYSPFHALIVYNPDPFYNLDEQICLSLAEGLKYYGAFSEVATIDLAYSRKKDYDLFVLCANTYNWAPDWKMKDLVNHWEFSKETPVVAITVGSGSTKRAKLKWEELIKANQMNLMESKDYWLMKPNNEHRMKERNVTVACDLAFLFGKDIGMQLTN